jgi:hypothetical protein
MGAHVSAPAAAPPGPIGAVGEYRLLVECGRRTWAHIEHVDAERVLLQLLPEVRCALAADSRRVRRLATVAIADFHTRLPRCATDAAVRCGGTALRAASTLRYVGALYDWVDPANVPSGAHATIESIDAAAKTMRLQVQSGFGAPSRVECSAYDERLQCPADTAPTGDCAHVAQPYRAHARYAVQREREAERERHRWREAERAGIEPEEEGRFQKTREREERQLERARALVAAADARSGPAAQAAVNECGVCFERERTRVLPCGHPFCRVCAERVVSGDDVRCPVCRVPQLSHAPLFL